MKMYNEELGDIGKGLHGLIDLIQLVQSIYCNESIGKAGPWHYKFDEEISDEVKANIAKNMRASRDFIL